MFLTCPHNNVNHPNEEEREQTDEGDGTNFKMTMKTFRIKYRRTPTVLYAMKDENNISADLTFYK